MKKLFTLLQNKKKLLFIAIFILAIISVSNSWAQTAIFNPSMSIMPYGSVNSNGSEGYANSIDNNVNTKFLDNYPDDGIGFTVDLGGVSKIASSISVTTANDSPGRDPKNYEVLGSNDGSNFTLIATGIIQCISTRFSTRFYCFENSTTYKYYRVNFTNTCSEYIFQFAEVQLYTPGPGIGGSVSANQSISGVIATTPSGEANLNSGSFVQVMAPNFTDDPEFGPSFTPPQTAAQSFKTSSNVILSAIKINVAEVITAGSYTLTIFQGEGTSGTQLMNQVVSVTNSGTNTFTLDTTLALIGEQSYTFKLETRDGNAKFNWTNSSGSDYSRGAGYTNQNNNNSDFNFQLVYQNNVNWQSVTLTGFFGGIQKWQKATDSNFSTPIDIPSISSTLEPYLVGDILQTTYFRAVVGCSSVYSDYVTIAVNSSKPLDSQCGVTLAALSTVIVPIAVPLAQGYKYKVTNTATNEVNYYTRSKTATFALSQRADTGSGSVAIKLSSTYAIAVAVKINGVFSDYGDACLVSTPLLPTTKIQDALCGTTLANINSYLYLKAQVAGQKGYRYKVTQGTEERTYDRIVTTFNPFQLKQLVGGAAYATTYEIAVSAFYNGAWQPYGASCTVTTPAAPKSKLATTQCGMTLNKTNTNVLTANYVGVAQAYRFEVSKGTSTYTVETASGLLRTFKLTEVAGLTLERGSTYGIRVAIKANGTGQPYGTSCNVTTYGSPAIFKMADPLAKPESVFNALAYPNPFSSAFQLELNTSSKAAVDLKVYDALGRLIENRQWNAAENSEQELGNNYPSGVYNIILNQGENVKTLRVIKR